MSLLHKPCCVSGLSLPPVDAPGYRSQAALPLRVHHLSCCLTRHSFFPQQIFPMKEENKRFVLFNSYIFLEKELPFRGWGSRRFFTRWFIGFEIQFLFFPIFFKHTHLWGCSRSHISTSNPMPFPPQRHPLLWPGDLKKKWDYREEQMNKNKINTEWNKYKYIILYSVFFIDSSNPIIKGH